MGEITFCISKNKGADQFQSNSVADQHICLCYMDSTIPLFSKFKISSFLTSPVLVQLGL